MEDHGIKRQCHRVPSVMLTATLLGTLSFCQDSHEFGHHGRDHRRCYVVFFLLREACVLCETRDNCMNHMCIVTWLAHERSFSRS